MRQALWMELFYFDINAFLITFCAAAKSNACPARATENIRRMNYGKVRANH
jgi:hypothetical protein